MSLAGLGSVRIGKNCDRGLENAARGSGQICKRFVSISTGRMFDQLTLQNKPRASFWELCLKLFVELRLKIFIAASMNKKLAQGFMFKVFVDFVRTPE